MAEQPLRTTNTGSVPVPDPTELTTRATDAAKDQLRREIDALRAVFEVRLDGMDRAIELQQHHGARVPADMDMRVEHLKELHEGLFRERLRSIEIQFAERDIRAEQAEKAAKEAVAAALQAAKEAVAAALQAAKEALSAQTEASERAISKSETAFIKAIDQQGTIIQTSTNALESKISDIKDRLTLIEGKTVGQSTQQGTQQAGSSQLLGIIGAIVAVGMLLFVVLRDAVMK